MTVIKSSLFGKVSIPQAVSTIAIVKVAWDAKESEIRFNTASGKYYCNFETDEEATEDYTIVSIPQAVSTIAIYKE